MSKTKVSEPWEITKAFPFGQAKPSYGSSANVNSVSKFEYLWTIDQSVKKLTIVASFSGIFAVGGCLPTGTFYED